MSEIDAKKVLERVLKIKSHRKLDLNSEEIIDELSEIYKLSKNTIRDCIVGYFSFIVYSISSANGDNFDDLKSYRVPYVGKFKPSKRKHTKWKQNIEKLNNNKNGIDN